VHSSTIRRQLTLFLEDEDAKVIEQFRKQYNPIQQALIACHVTLCREDELNELRQVCHNAATLPTTPCTIQFHQPSRFENGKGLWLRGREDNESFHTLRKQVLNGIVESPRMAEPHITLIHPRNGTCTDEIFESCMKMNSPTQLRFQSISLIEQTNGGPWKRIQDFSLQKR
jgi:2'-5' RNA ligase